MKNFGPTRRILGMKICRIHRVGELSISARKIEEGGRKV